MYRRLFPIIILFCALCAALPLCAQEAKPEETKMPKLEDAKTFEDVEIYLQKLGEKMQADIQALAQKGEITLESFGPFLQTMAENAVAAGEKMLKFAKSDDQREAAYGTMIQGLKQLVQREKLQHAEKLKKEKGFTEEDEKDVSKMMPLFQEVEKLETAAQKRLDTLFDEIEKEGKFVELVAKEKYTRFMRNASEIHADFTPEKFEKFKEEAKVWVNKKIEGLPPTQPLMTVIEVAGSEKVSAVDPTLHDKVVKELIAFVKSDKCSLPEEAKKEATAELEGYCKRCVGAELNLYGKTADDKDFDWKALRGKYVLVKFTASWCGPCKAEIPAMLKAYEKYKGKGFEIVSVYIWDKLDAVKKTVEEEKLPWIILSEELTEKAGQAPQGNAYGIQGVPTMLLIDKDGKVLATEVRGSDLEDKLAELLEK